MSILFVNGKISTLDKGNKVYEVLGVKDNKISFLGYKKDVEEIKNEYKEVIDLEKKLMLPGFNDSHMHLLNYGYTKRKLILNECTSIDEIINLSNEYIKNNDIKEGKWLLARGWNQDNLVENRFPTREDLDKISIDTPILMSRTCGHIAVCNSKALSLLDETLLENENIDVDNGIFKEDALGVLYGAVEKPSLEDMKEMIYKTCEELLKHGITSVQTDDFDAMPDSDFREVIRAYEELKEEGKLNVRIYEQCLLGDKEKLKEMIDYGYTTGTGDEWFKVGPLKILLDGSLGGKTAYISKGYLNDSDNKGVIVYSQDELNDYVEVANKNNMQIAIHAIGDGAMEMCINAFDNVARDNKNTLRHGIVHCQITTNEIINKFKENNILAYIQPIFLDYDLHIVEDRVGVERAQETYAFKTMIDNNIRVSIGSDAPVVHFNSMENLYSAITRMDLKGYPNGGWLPKEKLEVNEALKAFTIEGAYASFEEDIKGTLELGKLADLVVLQDDIYEIDNENIKDIKVYMTIVDGKIKYLNDN